MPFTRQWSLCTLSCSGQCEPGVDTHAAEAQDAADTCARHADSPRSQLHLGNNCLRIGSCSLNLTRCVKPKGRFRPGSPIQDLCSFLLSLQLSNPIISLYASRSKGSSAEIRESLWLNTQFTMSSRSRDSLPCPWNWGLYYNLFSKKNILKNTGGNHTYKNSTYSFRSIFRMGVNHKTQLFFPTSALKKKYKGLGAGESNNSKDRDRHLILFSMPRGAEGRSLELKNQCQLIALVGGQ